MSDTNSISNLIILQCETNHRPPWKKYKPNYQRNTGLHKHFKKETTELIYKNSFNELTSIVHWLAEPKSILTHPKVRMV